MIPLLIVILVVLVVLALAVYAIRLLITEQPFQNLAIAVAVIIGILVIIDRAGFLR
jgi:hypothetical protein